MCPSSLGFQTWEPSLTRLAKRAAPTVRAASSIRVAAPATAKSLRLAPQPTRLVKPLRLLAVRADRNYSSSQCLDPGPGTYASMDGLPNCAPCAAGHASSSGATICSPCPSTRFDTVRVLSAPLCAVNTFSAIPGSSTCSTCSGGSFNNAPGVLSLRLRLLHLVKR